MTERLGRAWELAKAGEVAGALRELRIHADHVPPGELARLAARVAALAGYEELAAASRALAERPADAQAQWDFGYVCLDSGAAFLAVPVLREALRQLPEPEILTELTVALCQESRDVEAVRLLLDHEEMLRDWPDRYHLAHSAVLSGDLELAAEQFDRLVAPDDPRWAPDLERVRRMITRGRLASTATSLDDTDLRGWHFVLTGTILTTLSPYGFDAGMTGRFALLNDTYDGCRHGLERLRVVLRAASRTPRAVALLPDRSSRVLGLAAARLLEVPTEEYLPTATGTLIVAYDLTAVDKTTVTALRDRAVDQVLFEHARRWTRPPAVGADINTLLHQLNQAPWDERPFHQPGDGSVTVAPADERPAEELADLVLAADPAADPGDGATPPDPDEALTAFTRQVRAEWLIGTRFAERSPGPVPSSSFI